MNAITRDIVPIELQPSAMIEAFADGTWQPSETGFEALLLPVSEVGGGVIDVVAWQIGEPSIWWLRRGVASYVGEHELILARRDRRPVRLVATPKEYLALWGYAVCILDWRADVRAILAQASNAVDVVGNKALCARVRRIVDQRPSDRMRISLVAA